MNLFYRWKALWDSNLYHGWGRRKHYFEGWYYKLVDKDQINAIAIIPGISKGWDGRHHAFIQVLNGIENESYYFDFPLSSFKSDRNKFDIKIGENRFTQNSIKLKLDDLHGSLKFKHVINWPKYLGAPGIMGWYSFVPFMQCYHGIMSMDHDIDGALYFKNSKIDFSGGKGYSEKDWGISFPRAWIWMQSNHFKDANNAVSLSASVAHIPWMGSYFIGYIVGLYFNAQLYRFASYTKSKMKASVKSDHIFLSFKNNAERLEIEAYKNTTAALVSPIKGAMTGKIEESLDSVIKLRFFINENLIFDKTGSNSGLELAGDIGVLLTEKWRH